LTRPLWRQFSEQALPLYASEASRTGDQVDFALIDGGHGWPTVFVDFCYAYATLRSGGYMMIDDIQIHAVKKLARFITKSWQFELVADLQKSLIFRKKVDQTSMGDFGAQPYINAKSKEDEASGRAFTLF